MINYYLDLCDILSWWNYSVYKQYTFKTKQIKLYICIFTQVYTRRPIKLTFRFELLLAYLYVWFNCALRKHACSNTVEPQWLEQPWDHEH